MQELNNRGVDTSIFDCSILIYTQQKGNLETAQKKLKDILKKNSEYVPALVNLSLCLFMLKKSTDARNYLKTALKNDYQL
jgi:lipopolysaccharide biosynthesis regulator YciM